MALFYEELAAKRGLARERCVVVFHEERGKKKAGLALQRHSMKSKTGLARERSVALFYEELERKRG